MGDSVETKADSTAAPKKAAVVKKKAAKKSDGVKVKNICKKAVNTSKSIVQPGKEGYATEAEARQLHRYLEVIK